MSKSSVTVIVVMTIDRHPPGEDVTGVYDAQTEARLIDEGYLEIVEPGAEDEGEEGLEDGDGDSG